MQLHYDLVREILLQLESAPANRSADSVKVPDSDEDRILEHLELLEERGLIVARLVRTSGRKRILTAFVERLTWEGHEFLNDARNEEVWIRTKQIVQEKGGSASFEVFKALLSQVALKVFGLA